MLLMMLPASACPATFIILLEMSAAGSDVCRTVETWMNQPATIQPPPSPAATCAWTPTYLLVLPDAPAAMGLTTWPACLCV